LVKHDILDFLHFQKVFKSNFKPKPKLENDLEIEKSQNIDFWNFSLNMIFLDFPKSFQSNFKSKPKLENDLESPKKSQNIYFWNF
jgi:hypothetical protein